MRVLSKVCVIAFCALFGCGGLLAAAETPLAYVIDPVASRITFRAKSTLHPVEGQARRFAGEFSVVSSPSSLEASGEVVVEVEQLLTDNKGLDRNMHRMFESREYPQARCRIGSLQADLSGTGPAVGRLKAVLTIRQIDQPLECEVTVTPDEESFVVRGRIPLSLKTFDLRPPTILGVIRMQDEVVVDFDVTLRRR